MAKLWADNIIKGKKTFDDVPEKLVDKVKAKFAEYVVSGKITEEEYKKYVGEDYVAE